MVSTSPSTPAKSQSLALRPTRGPISFFLHSQFCTKPQPVPLSPSTSLSTKTAIITGGASGLGLHHARQLLGLNLSRLILAVRDTAKGEAVAARFRDEFKTARVDVWELEMTSYGSIVGFVERVRRDAGAAGLDIAVLNVGVTHVKFERDKVTGHERVVQVNYLGTALLAMLLVPVMSNTKAFRDDDRKPPGLRKLTIVGSGVAYMAKVPNRHERPFLTSFDDVEKTAWDPVERYNCSKGLLHFFMVRLLDYLPRPEESGLVVNIVDPGYCKGSGLHRDAEGGIGMFLAASKALTGRTLENGAWCYTDAVVVKGAESHGCFVMDWQIYPFMKLVYTPEGEKLMDALWEETMAEFDFAGVRGMLEGLRK